jgi:hypothetical protein
MTSTREQIMDSQLEPQNEADHRVPLQPSTPTHSHYRPAPTPPLPGYHDYAEFTATPRQPSPTPATSPAPVMFPGQTMMVLFLLMVAAAFWGSVLFYLVLKFLHLVY